MTRVRGRDREWNDSALDFFCASNEPTRGSLDAEHIHLEIPEPSKSECAADNEGALEMDQ